MPADPTIDPAVADEPAGSDGQPSGDSPDRVLPSTIRASGATTERNGFSIGSSHAPRRGPRDLFAETPLSDVMLPETTAPAVLAALEPDRMSVASEPDPARDDEATAPASALAGIDRRLLLLLVLVVVLAGAAWILSRQGAADLLAVDDVAIDTPERFDSDVPDEAVAPPPIAPDVADEAVAPPPIAPDVADEPVDPGAEVVVAEPSEESPAGPEPGPPPIAVAPAVPADEIVPDVPPAPADQVVPTAPPAPTDDVVDEPVEPVTPVSVPPADDAVDEPAATPADDGRRVEIDIEIGPCPYGSACLRAGFVAVGFDTLPDEFVCEFANGSRYTFDLPDRTVEYACATGSRGSSITIEIDGVRSETVVFD